MKVTVEDRMRILQQELAKLNGMSGILWYTEERMYNNHIDQISRHINALRHIIHQELDTQKEDHQ